MAGEWPLVPLENLTEDDSPITYGVVKPGEESSDGILLVRGGDIKHGQIDLSSLRTITKTLSQQYRRTILRGGELVVSLVGEPGEVAIVPPALVGANINRAVGLVRLRQDVNAAFVKYFLRSTVGRRSVFSLSLGSVQQVVNLSDLKRVLVPRPEPMVENAIAHILGTLDEKIGLNRRMNETLEAMARALFKSWFVDFDPVRAKAEGRDPGLPRHLAALFPDSLEDSELGEIPKGWSAAPLFDLATYINGAAYAAFQPNDERRGLPIIKIAELKAGVTAQTKFSDVHMSDKYRIARGDILFSWSGNPDTSIDTFVWTNGPGWLNQHIFRVLPHHHDERAFVLSTLKALRPVFAEIARDKQTTGLGHVTAKDMKRLLVARPDDRVMQAWSAVAGPLHGRALRSDLEALDLAALRDALLPKLISGEVRVKDAGRVVAGAAG